MGNAAELRRHKDVLVRMLAGDALQPVTKGGSAQVGATGFLDCRKHGMMGRRSSVHCDLDI